MNRSSESTARSEIKPIYGAVLCLGILILLTCNTVAQSGAVKPPRPTVEPGLETAVKWRWRVEPAPGQSWGPPAPTDPNPSSTSDPTQVAASSQNGKPAPVAAVGPPAEPVQYEVKRGDSLYVIARQYGVSVEIIKRVNSLTGDVIRIGQILRIPNLAEIQALAPPKAIVVEDEASTSAAVPKVQPPTPPLSPKYSRPINEDAARATRVVLIQAFLDRQMFSAGPIDGTDGPVHQATLSAFKQTHPGVLDFVDSQLPAALVELGGAYIEYQLTAADLRWIVPLSPKRGAPRSGRSSSIPTPDPEWEDLMGRDFLYYRSAWEFVAERFHCSESFLRRINTSIRQTPVIGTTFLVPNVEPFDVSTIFDQQPIQPQGPPNENLRVRIVNNTVLEVWQDEIQIARMPVSAARPGLFGRGKWTVLGAISRPQLISTGELIDPPQALIGAPSTVIEPTPPVGVILPPGPNNPVGPLWIDLAKGSDTRPLPFGLHGTSIPGTMTREESLGGFRVANWNIIRLARLLPPGTKIEWQ